MHTDPALYIIFAAIVSGILGFFACALLVSRRLRDHFDENYWNGYAACNREHEKLKPKL